MRLSDFPKALSLLSVVALVSSCRTEACSTVLYCLDGVTLQFQPAIVAKQDVVVTIFGDDASYSDTYSPTQESGTLYLNVENNVDAGGFTVKSARLDPQMPSTVTYNIIADGITIAQGTVTPEYQRVSKGSSEDCMQSCTQANVTVLVSQ